MDKIDLTRIINNVFEPAGFKKEGNLWLKENDSLIKKLELQKSDYSNKYYLNFGYVIKSIPLENLTIHVSDRVSEEINLTDSLDGGTGIIDLHNWEIGLTELLKEKILSKFESVKSEQDLVKTFADRPTMNDIPLVVIKHFNLPLPK